MNCVCFSTIFQISVFFFFVSASLLYPIEALTLIILFNDAQRCQDNDVQLTLFMFCICFPVHFLGVFMCLCVE